MSLATLRDNSVVSTLNDSCKPQAVSSTSCEPANNPANNIHLRRCWSFNPQIPHTITRQRFYVVAFLISNLLPFNRHWGHKRSREIILYRPRSNRKRLNVDAKSAKWWPHGLIQRYLSCNRRGDNKLTLKCIAYNNLPGYKFTLGLCIQYIMLLN